MLVAPPTLNIAYSKAATVRLFNQSCRLWLILKPYVGPHPMWVLSPPKISWLSPEGWLKLWLW